MSRVYKILPDIDDDFHPALGFVMFIMALIMITSLFSYRSLIQALAMIYTSYVGLTFKRKIQNYLNTKKDTFRPSMAPYKAAMGGAEEVEEETNSGDLIAMNRWLLKRCHCFHWWEEKKMFGRFFLVH